MVNQLPYVWVFIPQSDKSPDQILEFQASDRIFERIATEKLAWFFADASKPTLLHHFASPLKTEEDSEKLTHLVKHRVELHNRRN